MITDLEIKDTDKEPVNRKFVIVFDIDGVICNQTASEFSFQNIVDNITDFQDLHPECPPPATFSYLETTYYHYFPPYLEILFNYLINHNCRIVFFSAASEDRNLTILEKLLLTPFSEEKYQQLKSAGQFDIFSSQHLRPGITNVDPSGTVKDLSIVLKDKEDINNSILIEDQPRYAAYNSPCITALNLYQWDLFTMKDSPLCFVKNNTYYLLGIFSNFFDTDQHLSSSLNEWSQQLYINKKPFDTNTPFIREMIFAGLNEVNKQRPEAVFYGELQPLEITCLRYKQHAPRPLKP